MGLIIGFADILDNIWVQIGLVVIMVFVAVMLFVLCRKGKMRFAQTRVIVFGAVTVSLAAVLNLIKIKTGIILGGVSGSITLLRMLPLVMYAVTFGTVPGLLVGVAYGLVDMLFGIDASGGAVQVLLDYIVAFGLIGLSGLTRNSKQPFIFGTLIALVGRFAASFISGAVFFGMYAPEGMNVWLYSLCYQCVTVLPDMLLVLIAFVLVQNTSAFKQLVRTMRGDNAEENEPQQHEEINSTDEMTENDNAEKESSQNSDE